MHLDLEANAHLLEKLFPTRMTIKVIAVDLQGIDTMLVSHLTAQGFAACLRPRSRAARPLSSPWRTARPGWWGTPGPRCSPASR